MAPPTACANCQSVKDSLKTCGNCKAIKYCNRDCQEAHWARHKENYARLAQGQHHTYISSEEFTQYSLPLPLFMLDLEQRIRDNVVLHDLPQQTTFQLPINTFRTRQEDEFVFAKVKLADSVYDNAPTSEAAFRTFMGKVSAVPGLLPPWWLPEKIEECIAYSRSTPLFSLALALARAHVNAIWRDERMHLKLMMFGRVVYGYCPGGGQMDLLMAHHIGVC